MRRLALSPTLRVACHRRLIAAPLLAGRCGPGASPQALHARGAGQAAAAQMGTAAAAQRRPPPPGDAPPPPSTSGRKKHYRIDTLAPGDKGRKGGDKDGRPAPAAAASFAETGLGPDLLAAVAALGLATPTPVQASAIPALLAPGRPDVLVASHTGSGKTLAYLLPLVQELRDAEARAAAGAALGVPPGGALPPPDATARPRRPRALVLGPTRELTDQTGRVAKAVGHVARFRSAVANGGGILGAQAAALASRSPDVLIATPARVAALAAKGALFYGDVRTVVLDEADTMFDAGFGGEVRAVLAAVRGGRAGADPALPARPPARVVLVAATLTGPVRALLAREFPDMVRVETDTLHRGAPGARHSFLPVGGADKLSVLASALARPLSKRQRVVIFCNTVASARAAAHALEEGGTCRVLSVHGDMPPDARAAALAEFISSSGSSSSAPPPAAGQQLPVPPPPPPLPSVLVATDIAARGLDIPNGGIDEVLNFDFPRSAVDYLHRAGRTARAGASGRVTSLVAGPRDRTLAARIQAALDGNAPLDGVASTRNAVAAHMRPKAETLRARAADAKTAKLARKGRRGAARFVEEEGGGGGGGPKGRGAALKKRGGGSSGGGSPRQATFRGGK